MIRPFLLALQFLTRLPVVINGVVADEEVGRSLLYYPLVGLVIGVLLALLAWGLATVPPMVGAALLLVAWVLLTGGLHLDGLADSADAWAGGLGDRNKTLAIMKDPYCGPVGVVTLVLVLLLKFAALVTLIPQGEWSALVIAAVMGRSVVPLLFLTTPYVRSQGLGALLASHLPHRMVAVMLAITGVMIVVSTGVMTLWMVGTALALFVLVRGMMVRRINGITGDTTGALVEITEAVVLLTATLTL